MKAFIIHQTKAVFSQEAEVMGFLKMKRWVLLTSAGEKRHVWLRITNPRSNINPFPWVWTTISWSKIRKNYQLDSNLTLGKVRLSQLPWRISLTAKETSNHLSKDNRKPKCFLSNLKRPLINAWILRVFVENRVVNLQ